MSTVETRSNYTEHLDKAASLCEELAVELTRAEHHLEKRYRARLEPSKKRALQLDQSIARALQGILEARKTRESQL